MSDVWSRYHLVLTGFLLALPVAMLVVALRACALRARVLRVRVLRRGGEPVPEPPGAPLESAATRRSGPVRCAAFEVAAVYGTLPWLAMTLTPDPGAPRRIQLVPLHDLAALAGAPAQTVAVQLIGNLLVFAAAGFFLPLRYPALRSLPRVALLAALGSVLIETVQYAADLGRVSSIDDVLVNAAGAGLFALLSRPLWRR